MNNRRRFLKSSTYGLFGGSLLPFSASFDLTELSDNPIVKQPDQVETIYVRENTPMSFHIIKNTDGVSSVSICSEEIQAGSQIPIHKHLYADEYFYFIKGTGLFIINDDEKAFRPGTSAFVPKNTWHGLKNNGTENVMLVFGFSPAGFEDFFRQIGTPKGQPFRQKPKVELDRLAKQFGMVYK